MSAAAPGTGRSALLAAVSAALLPQPSGAVRDDAVELYVEQEVTRDDNVFRLSDEVDPETVIGSTTRADTLHTTTVGLDLDLEPGRQRIRGNVAVNRVRFETFDALDVDGYEADLAWDWVVGERWSGEIGGGATRTLASLANIQGGVQLTEPNVLTVGELRGSAEYRIAGGWRVAASVARETQDNSTDESRISDATIGERGLTFSYRSQAGSRIGITRSVRDAELPNRQAFAGVPVDNSYEQTGVEVFVDWAATRDSQLSGRVGRLDRRHDELPGRDFSGNVYELRYDWRPTETLDLSISKSRDRSPWEQVNVGFVMQDMVTLGGYWRVTGKVAVTVHHSDGERRYLADPGLADPAAEPRVEDITATQLGIDWDATDYLVFGIEWRSDRRDASVPLGDFDAGMLSLRVRGHF